MPTPSSSPLPPATVGVPSSSPPPPAHSSWSPLPPSPARGISFSPPHPVHGSPSSSLPPDESSSSPPPAAEGDRTVPTINTSSDLNQPQDISPPNTTTCRPTSDCSTERPPSPSLSPPLSPSHHPTNYDRTAPVSSTMERSLDIQLSIFSNWGHPTHLGLTEVSLTRHHVSGYCGPASQSPVVSTESWGLRGWELD